MVQSLASKKVDSPQSRHQAVKSSCDDGPVVFSACKPDHRLDVVLSLPVREVHCHSAILRQKSGYFRAFLDRYPQSGEGNPGIPILETKDTFDFHYTLKVDADKHRGLQPASKTDDAGWSRLAEDEKISYTNEIIDLLRMMYLDSRRDDLDYARQHALLDVAEFYIALRAIHSFNGHHRISHPSLLRDSIAACPRSLIFAYRIRSVTLFREMFIHTVGQMTLLNISQRLAWSTILEEYGLASLVLLYHGSLVEYLMSVHYDIAYMFSKFEHEYEIQDHLSTVCKEHVYRSKFDANRAATQIRALKDHELHVPHQQQYPEDRRELVRAFTDLWRRIFHPPMRNCLILQPDLKAGTPECRYLLCTDLHDDSIPWNREIEEY